MNRQELLKTAKPILFNTDMVKAIQDGRKVQTRMVINTRSNKSYLEKCKNTDYIYAEMKKNREYITTHEAKYKKGDVLWVREPAKVIAFTQKEGSIAFQYLSDKKHITITNGIDRFIGNKKEPPNEWYFTKNWINKKQGIPNGCIKEMARIFLKVTNVRVERLQDISSTDAIKEGIGIFGKEIEHSSQLYENYTKGKSSFMSIVNVYDQDSRKQETVNVHGLGWLRHPITSFATLWNSVSKDGYDWNSNPFVFVYEFEVIK